MVDAAGRIWLGVLMVKPIARQPAYDQHSHGVITVPVRTLSKPWLDRGSYYLVGITATVRCTPCPGEKINERTEFIDGLILTQSLYARSARMCAASARVDGTRAPWWGLLRLRLRFVPCPIVVATSFAAAAAAAADTRLRNLPPGP